jgi:hypothetical protein
MFDDCTGNWQEVSTLFESFFYILVAGIYVTITEKKCLQFVFIFADLLPVKCQAIFLILAVKCLANCLLPQSIFLKIVCSMPVQCMEAFFAERSIIQTFHRLFEAYCLYNRMEKLACFDKRQTIFVKSMKSSLLANQVERWVSSVTVELSAVYLALDVGKPAYGMFVEHMDAIVGRSRIFIDSF